MWVPFEAMLPKGETYLVRRRNEDKSLDEVGTW